MGSDQVGFEDYFFNHINPEGTPSSGFDPEYLLKPWKERLPKGAPRRLFEECLKTKLVSVESDTKIQFDTFSKLIHSGDPEIINNLKEMMGLPIKALNEKLNHLKTSNGTAPKLCFCYSPTAAVYFVPEHELFWKQVCSNIGLEMLDLAPGFHALETAFFPTSQGCCSRHPTLYGNELLATLLNYYLPAQGWVPDGVKSKQR